MYVTYLSMSKIDEIICPCNRPMILEKRTSKVPRCPFFPLSLLCIFVSAYILLSEKKHSRVCVS
uniref:Uncharacterized protein n=1 Tax=Arundo donax TaxID=35708 RepID=A0A0A9E3K8_ARUDO